MHTHTSWLSFWKKPSHNDQTRRVALKQKRNWSPAIESLESRELLTGFNFAGFSDPTGLTLLGAASITGDKRLRLTPAIGGQSGAAWFTADKQFAGLQFETTFQFQLTENFDAPGGSDGFVFIIQNAAPTYLAGGGGTLGYDGLKNSLAVEFDTFQNSEVADPSPSHISVHTNGTGSNGWSESLSLGVYNTSPALLDDAAVHTAKITYTPGTLAVYLDDLTTPKLTVSVDLAEKLALDAGRAWIGFTSATGGGWQNHDILNWTYAVVPDVTTTAWVADASVVEGDDAVSSQLVFSINRSGDVSGTTTINWTTENRTATAGSDYTAASGVVTFGPGETEAPVAISVQGDTSIESHETLALRLTTITGGAVSDRIGIGTIATDDVTISVNDSLATEGDATIVPLGPFATAGSGLEGPYAMIVGPYGDVYVSARESHSVLRYEAGTGNPLPADGKPGAEFVSPGSGGLNMPRDLAFGPTGNLCVVSEGTDSVLCYDPNTGEPIGTEPLVASGAGGLDAPRGLTFQGDYVYVTSVGTETASPGKDSVLRFDAHTGEPAGISGLPGDAVFIASGSGGLDNPSRLVFDPYGKAYVSSTAGTVNSATSNSILRYDSTTGAPAGISGQPGNAVFVSPGSGGLDGPVAMVFRSDGLYVTSWRNNAVLRYDASSGAFAGSVVSSGSGGLNTTIDLLFESNDNFLVSSNGTDQILRFGAASQAVFTVSLSSASANSITVDYSTTGLTAVQDSDYNPAADTLTFAPGETTRTILVRTLGDEVLEPDETFTVNLRNLSPGATIADDRGIGTILDPGHEIHVNSTTAGTQVTTILPVNYNPLETHQAVASDSAGNFVVAWSGNGVGDSDGIFFQRYDSNRNPLEFETRANVTTANAQANPVVGRASTNGKYVIAWNSTNGVYGRVFNSNGSAATGELTIAAGSSSTRNYVDSIAVDADGDFVVLYKQFVQKGIGESRYWQAQRFNSAGQAQGGAIRVTTLNLINGQGAVAGDSTGNFVVVWDDNGVNAQRYNSSGKKVGSQILVSPAGVLIGGNVGVDADGDFVVTWENSAQVFNKDGTRRGGILNFSSARGESIAVQANGNFVLAWTQAVSYTNTDVYAQRFDLNGVPLEAARRVNQTLSWYQENSSVAVAADGDYVVAWNTPDYQSNGPSTPTVLNSEIRARRFDVPAALLAARGTNTAGAITTLPEIQANVAEAIARWKATGLSAEQEHTLENLRVEMASLSGATLGLASGNTILLDDNAAGWGWYVDATPGSDREFKRRGNQGEQGRMDLLTALAHEMGHLLGLHHVACDSVMRDSLAPGERRMPVAHDLAIGQLLALDRSVESKSRLSIDVIDSFLGDRPWKRAR